jgi:hypothetical protein
MREELLLPGFEKDLVNGNACDKFWRGIMSIYFGMDEIRMVNNDIDFLTTADALVWSHVINWYNLIFVFHTNFILIMSYFIKIR